MKPNKLFLGQLILLALVFVVFWPTLNNEFVDRDDTAYLLENPLVKELSWENIGRIFTENKGLYRPLAILSFALEFHFFGSQPQAYHFHNLLLHAANVLLVFWLFGLMTADFSVAFLGALLFSIHPTRVESVAWITERKDVLSTLFFLASLICYVRYTQGRLWRFYGATLGCFVLSLLAKPSGLLFPLILFLVDVTRSRPLSRRLFWEKIPFLLAALVFFYIGLAGAQASNPSMGFPEDAAIIMAFSFLHYLRLIFWPFDLCVIYHRSSLMGPALSSCGLGALFLVVAIFVLAAWWVRRARYPFFGVTFFAILIALPIFAIPFTGVIFFAADRCLYGPFLGLSLVFGQAVTRFYRRRGPGLRRPVVVLCALLFGALGVATHERVKVWHDSVSLWNDVLKKYPENMDARMNRAVAYALKGDYASAIADFDTIDPDTRYRDDNLAGIYIKLGMFDRAESMLENIIKNDPTQFDACAINLASAYMGTGKTSEATQVLRQVLAGENDKNKVMANYSLGVVAKNSGDPDTARYYFREAVRKDPGYAAAYFALAQLEAEKGHDEEALRYYQQAVFADPSYRIEGSGKTP